MVPNENYEELKETTKTFLQVITSDNLYYCLLLIVIMVVTLKLIDIIFYPLRKRKSMAVSFLKGCLKVFVIFTIGMRICSVVPILEDFTNQIFLSSSLIVVVLGFVFQEGLSNIVHGFILSIFKPFKIGDRVSISVDGTSITGYIESVDARQTILRNVVNSSLVIIPNSKMDLSIIQNNYFGGNQTSSAFLDLGITYESDLDHAIEVITRTIENNPYVAALRSTMKDPEPVSVMIRELGDSSINLRAVVVTKTVEENFQACSDIRKELVVLFQQDPLADFAYPHLQVIPTPLQETTVYEKSAAMSHTMSHETPAGTKAAASEQLKG